MPARPVSVGCRRLVSLQHADSSCLSVCCRTGVACLKGGSRSGEVAVGLWEYKVEAKPCLHATDVVCAPGRRACSRPEKCLQHVTPFALLQVECNRLLRLDLVACAARSVRQRVQRGVQDLMPFSSSEIRTFAVRKLRDPQCTSACAALPQ